MRRSLDTCDIEATKEILSMGFLVDRLWEIAASGGILARAGDTALQARLHCRCSGSVLKNGTF